MCQHSDELWQVAGRGIVLAAKRGAFPVRIMKSTARAAISPLRARAPHVDNRLSGLLDAAAAQFAAKGFQAASVRDIVGAVGMLPGSLYYHFATKDELLLAVYAEGVRRIDTAVTHAVAHESDPWKRLEAACVAHLESLLDQSAYARVVVSVQPRDASAIATPLTELRDSYERKFVALLEALQLGANSDRKAMRMLLLGALNWTPVWYTAAGATPESIAREYVQLLKHTGGSPRCDVRGGQIPIAPNAKRQKAR